MRTTHGMHVVLSGALAGLTTAAVAAEAPPIDRLALVTRHNVRLTKADPLTPLSVGNGELAFTADITGLQTFPEFHEPGMPLGTFSQWGWHSFPNPEHYTDDDVTSAYDSHGRALPYLDGAGGVKNAARPERAQAANAWLRANPHRMDLGRIGMLLRKSDGTAASISDLTETEQTLDLWRGTLESRFTFDGQPVRVVTLVHPERDLVAARIESPLVASGRLSVSLAFSYPAGDWRRASDWQHPERHQTQLRCGAHRCELSRRVDAANYTVSVAWSGDAKLNETAAHHYALAAAGGQALELVVSFVNGPRPARRADFAATRAAAEAHWARFWKSGGAIDLSGSADPRAAELERRIVLSQYLTAVQCAGSLPPQETGLVADSWFGKFHLEMHWWHAAQFALWGRPELLERSLPWYQRILPVARANAQRQGYRGVRWPKMVGPEGHDTPSPIGPFLIWQQPHPIFYAELLYRCRPDRATLTRYREIVFETAEFMASYATWDPATRRFVLGPPLIPAQESYAAARRQLIDPTFELAYWRFGLATAQKWRERLGLGREPAWDRVLRDLAKPTVRDGVYAAIEVEPFTLRQDHPSMLGALGMLPPTDAIDPVVMRRTLADVRANWDWPSTWGWDYPLMAMTAARVGEPQAAIDALFVDAQKNRYLANGHNYQREDLPLYLPGNGGLLYAVALMAAGWDGAPPRNAPGFPDNGRWIVRHEGLRPAP